MRIYRVIGRTFLFLKVKFYDCENYIRRYIAYIRNDKITTTQPSLCKLLKSKAEIDECTAFILRTGYISHIQDCKNWDLAHIIPEIGNGRFLDMGSSDSYILKNITLKGVRGKKHGIDLRPPHTPVKGVSYSVGDLMETGFPDKYFKNISCLSVIEHEVSFSQFAREVGRLLDHGGKLFLTFDYWNPKLNVDMKMYGRAWQPLDEKALRQLIFECEQNDLFLVEEFNWGSGEAVIREGYHSPHPEFEYTFGLAVFQKK